MIIEGAATKINPPMLRVDLSVIWLDPDSLLNLDLAGLLLLDLVKGDG